SGPPPSTAVPPRSRASRRCTPTASASSSAACSTPSRSSASNRWRRSMTWRLCSSRLSCDRNRRRKGKSPGRARPESHDTTRGSLLVVPESATLERNGGRSFGSPRFWALAVAHILLLQADLSVTTKSEQFARYLKTALDLLQ